MAATSPRTTTPELVDRAIAAPAAYLAGSAGVSPADTSIERWARGVALRELGRLDEARTVLERARTLAIDDGDGATAAGIDSSLALALFHLGETDEALRVAEAAGRSLTGEPAARCRMQHGLLLQRLGRHREAIAAYDAALPALLDAGDLAAVARLTGNRGVAATYLGALTQARTDLAQSLDHARTIGSARGAAFALQNLGFLAGREGRLLDALRAFAEAGEVLDELGDGASARAALSADQAQVLADAGLLDEALQQARSAVGAHAAAGDTTNLAEAQLLVARLALLAGALEEAAEAAAEAADRLQADGRDGWVRYARFLAAAVRTEAGDATPVHEAVALADDLQDGGWSREAQQVRTWAVRRAIDAGDGSTAAHLLATEPSLPLTAVDRADHGLATALLEASRGHDADAERTLGAALDDLHRSRVALGSAELRAAAARHTTELVRLGVRLALRGGRVDDALRLLDRVRAADRAVAPVPPDDTQLADDVAELRRLDAELQERGQRGTPSDDLHRARVEVERRIRDRTRHLAGAAGAAPLTVDLERLRVALGGRPLVAYCELDGRLQQLVLGASGSRHREVGSVRAVREAVGHARAALRRLARSRTSAAALAAAEVSLGASASQLRGLLGLDGWSGPGPVVVPSSALDGLPWALLAGAEHDLPLLTPSSSALLTDVEVATSGALLVAGPRLPGAADEVSRLQDAVPGARTLAGDAATCAAVLDTLPDVELAHVAAHGTFRSDNPLFSSLELADGPLIAHELARLPRAPRRLVLSSCDAAAATTLPGDAVLGLSAVLLGCGVRLFVAPTVEVADEATAPLMVALHRSLASGTSPGTALTRVLDLDAATDHRDRAVRAAFVAFATAEVLGDAC
jgi:tetratricopeptide (TPR) repeat protein